MVRLKMLICLLLQLILQHAAKALSVMSIDLGNEWMKIAIVSPGKPMEVVLNTDSARKTPLIVAFRDGERFFGEAAVSTNTRFPEKAFAHLLDLIGKRIDSPSVQRYLERFPYHNVTTSEDGTQLYLHHPEGMIFTPEELLAMIIQKAKVYAENAAGDGQKISDVVISIHPFFNQFERLAIKRAAQLAGLKVLQLMNTNTAVALNYGVFRRKDFNESASNTILFYDMGASMAIATVANYNLVKSKERGFLETHPQVVIKGVGYDRHLGGIEMQLRLRNHLAKLFAKQKSKKLEEITSNKRAMSKLLKEAARLKRVLSANTEHIAQVENVMNDLDLVANVKRSEFEELCKDLLGERVVKPISVALEFAGSTVDDLDQVVLFGGVTRIPKIQASLTEFLKGRELSKSVNADEAAALGAAYKAASLSKGFKVKTFLVKDTNLYPIQVDFSRDVESDDGNTKMKQMQRTLFPRNNPYPQKKLLTFSRHNADFEFFINYGDFSSFMSQEEIKHFGSMNITQVKVSGVGEIFSKHSGKENEAKGVKAHFRMDESGLLNLEGVEAVFETKVEEKIRDEKGNVVGDTLAKLGNTFSKLFSRSEGEEDTGKNETEADKKEVNHKKEEKQKANKTAVNETESGNATDSVKTEIKIKTIKEPLKTDSIFFGLELMDDEGFSSSKAKLEELNAKDLAKMAHEKAKNNLESFIHETKMKLYDEEFDKAVKEDERNKLMTEFNAASEWLEYESDGAETQSFKDRHRQLKKSSKEIYDRVEEHRKRPEALNALKEMLNISSMFLAGAQAVKEEDQIFTKVEVETLEKIITSTSKWYNESVKAQEAIPLTDNPKVLVREIAEKIASLDREVKYLVTKARITPPKRKSEEKSEDKEETTTIEKDEDVLNKVVPEEDGMKPDVETLNKEPPHSEL